MTPSEGQVNDRIALDTEEAREPPHYDSNGCKKYWVMLHALTKLNIVSVSSPFHYDGWVFSSAKKQKHYPEN